MTAVIRRLDETHLDAVIALHHDVIADMPAGTVASETDAFFQSHMNDCGQIFGALSDGDLIAYSVLGLPRIGDPNFGIDHHLSAGDLQQVAHIDGVAVRKDHRGSKWQQRMVIHRLEAARACGRAIALSTAAPGNVPSVINLLAAGMRICGVKEKFGGVRYLFRCDLTGDKPAKLQESLHMDDWSPVSDVTSGKNMIADGMVGAGYRQGQAGHNGPDIGWVHRERV